jgi:hypothetical protein
MNDDPSISYEEWFTAPRKLLGDLMISVIRQNLVVGRDTAKAVEVILAFLFNPTEGLEDLCEKYTIYLTGLDAKSLQDFKLYLHSLKLTYLGTWKCI